MNKGQVAIETEITKIKKTLLELGQMHPGSLSQQKRSRGGSPRGGSSRGNTYHQLSYSHAGKGHTKYVRPEDVTEVTQEIENYRRFRELTGKWVELAIELAKLRRDEGRLKRRITGKE
jgi:hypothetical protein